MGDEVFRIIFSDSVDQDTAENLLDEEGEWYDYDSGDRMMVNQDGLDLLYESEVDFDEV